jgi:hypothetical protein
LIDVAASVFDRKFRIKAPSLAIPTRYCSGKGRFALEDRTAREAGGRSQSGPVQSLRQHSAPCSPALLVAVAFSPSVRFAHLPDGFNPSLPIR